MNIEEFIDFIRKNNLDDNTEIIIQNRFVDRNGYEIFKEITPLYLNVKTINFLFRLEITKMKVKAFLNWLKENDVNEDSEIEITRFFDNDIVANGNFFENDLNYDKDLRMVQIFD